MDSKPNETAESRAFWDAIKKSADLVRSSPPWTQAGIVLSNNFTGPHAVNPKVLDALLNGARKRAL